MHFHTVLKALVFLAHVELIAAGWGQEKSEAGVSRLPIHRHGWVGKSHNEEKSSKSDNLENLEFESHGKGHKLTEEERLSIVNSRRSMSEAQSEDYMRQVVMVSSWQN